MKEGTIISLPLGRFNNLIETSKATDPLLTATAYFLLNCCPRVFSNFSIEGLVPEI